ncbi:hypothetical protein AAFC00_002766 [Neodothiora populina]|uniref:PQ loop repeat protein n=1 Tax=Neodothiora populina TaxID=2781224 RepID=A0ABR3P8G6_9PEZI
MSWQLLQSLRPALPEQCSPESEILQRFSATFHTCIPTNLALISTTLGTLSIVSWLFAQLPQIYKNHSLKSTSGLSIFFLVEWCLGDLTNLLGAIFTHQAAWQTIIAAYYCLVDFMLVAQWLWYEKLKHGYTIRLAWPRKQHGENRDNEGGDGDMSQVVIEGMSALSRQTSGTDTSDNRSFKSQAKDINTTQRVQAGMWRMPDYRDIDEDGNEKDGNGSPPCRAGARTIYRTQASGSLGSPSPRTIVMIACLISLVTASPVKTPPPTMVSQAVQEGPTPLEAAGMVLSWVSTVLYLGSRVPQIYKNWSRKSTAGLSPGLFIAAFFGNLFYSTSIATNPNAWYSCGPYGNSGWAGKEGNDRVEWLLNALPFWLGAAGVLGLDGAVGVQFLMYGDGGEGSKVVILEEAGDHGRWRWRRVSGWMRGWVPNFNDPTDAASDGEGEETGLLEADRQNHAAYGGTQDAHAS